MALVPEITFK